MKTFLNRCATDLALVWGRLLGISLAVFFSFFISLIVLSFSLDSLKSGAYSGSPPKDVYLFELALFGEPGETGRVGFDRQLVSDYLAENPKVQLQVPVRNVAYSAQGQGAFSEPAGQGLVIFSAGNLTDAWGAPLLDAPPPGTFALAGSLAGQVPEVTDSTFGTTPVQKRAVSTSLVVRDAGGWAADYSDFGLLLGAPNLLTKFSFPLDINTLSQGLVCLCGQEEAQDAAYRLTELMQTGGYQLLAVTKDPVSAMSLADQLSVAQELLITMLPGGLLLAAGIIAGVFALRLNLLRATAFLVERINGLGVLQQLVRVNILVTLGIIVPAWCALGASKVIIYAVPDGGYTAEPLFWGLVAYAHGLASLIFYVNYRKENY